MFVYIALDEEANVIKVGISIEPDKRVHKLSLDQDALVFKLHHCKEFDKETAKLLEKKLLGYMRFKYNHIDYKFSGCTETFRIEDKEEYNNVVEFCKKYVDSFAVREDMDQEYLSMRERYRFDTVEKFLEYMSNYYRYYSTDSIDRISEITLRLIHRHGGASDYTKLLRDFSYKYSNEDAASKFARGLIESFPENNNEEHF